MGRINQTPFQKELLKARIIGVDTMCFLYQFSDMEPYASLTNTIFHLADQKRISIVTSTITIVETFVHVERNHDTTLLIAYEKVFNEFPNLKIISLDVPLARLSAKLRGKYTFLKTPDSIQISASLFHQASLFITNDKKLKQIKEIKVCSLDEFI